ncbi:MAG: phage tail tape measure protein [Sporolactobacillus sp.]
MAEEELAALRMSLTLKDMDFTHSIDAIKQKLAGVKSEFSVAAAGVKGFQKSLDGMKAKQVELTRLLDLQRQRVATLNGMYKESAQKAGEDAKATDKLKTEVNNAKAAQKRMEAQLTTMNERIEEQSSDWRKLSQDVDKNVSDSRQKIVLLNSQYKVLTAGVENFGTKSSQLRAESQNLTAVMTVESERVALLKQKYDALVQAKGADDRETRSAAIDLNKANAQMRETQRELIGVNSKLGVLGRSSRALDTLSNKAKTVSDKMTGMGKSMTVGVTLPIAGLFATGAKSYMSFNNELTQMRALLSDGSTSAATLNKQVSDLGKRSQKWSEQYGQSTTDINSGMMELIKKGYTYNQVVGAMPSLLQAARASGDDFTTVMSMATSSVEQFGLKSNNTQKMLRNTQRATDDLTFVANKTAAGFGDMGTAMEYVGPVAHTLGYSLEDTASAIGLLSNNGLLADKAGTALRGALSRMLKPTNKSAGAFKELGLSTDKMQHHMYNLPDLLDTINKHTQGMTKTEKAHLLAVAFGTESQTGMNILLQQGGDKLRNLSKETQNATGYTKKLSDEMGNSAEQKVKRLNASFQVLQQEIGKELVPELTPFVEDLDGLIKRFNDLPESTKHTILAFGLTAAATGPAVVGLGAVTRGLGSITGAASGTLGWLSKYSAQAKIMGTASKVEAAGGLEAAAGKAGALSGALGLLTSPVGVAAAGIAGVGIAAYAVNRYMYGLQDTSTKYADSLVKQHDANKKEISDFEQLRDKSHLTSTEFSRLMNLNEQLSKAKSPKQVQNLKDKMEELRDKSGLSNKQLQTMIQLSQDIAKKLPTSTNAVTKNGDAYAYNTKQIKANNQAKLNTAIDSLQQKRDAALGNELKYRRMISDNEISLSGATKGVNNLQKLRNEVEQNGYETVLKKYKSEQWNMKLTAEERQQSQYIYSLLENHCEMLNIKLSRNEKDTQELKKQIAAEKEHLGDADKLNAKIAHILLVENGINDSQHKGLSAIVAQVRELDSQKSKLDQLHASGKISNDQYDTGIKKIQGQIDKLNGVKDKILNAVTSAQLLNTTLSKKILKEIKFTGDTKQDAESINQALMKKVYKQVAVGVKMPGYKQVQLQEMAASHKFGGTSDWRGGLTWLAEHGQEAVHVPGQGTGVVKKKGVYNLPAHASVLPNTKTEKLLAGLPGFANGTGNYFDKMLGKGGTVSLSLQQLPEAIDDIVSQLGSDISDALQNSLSKMLGATGKGSKYVKEVVSEALKITGKSSSWAPGLISIAMHESGGNSSAVNPVKVLGQHATGLMQMLPSTFAANMAKGHTRITDGLDNMIAAIHYIDKRYGNPYNTPGIKSLSAGGKYSYYATGTMGTPRTQNAVLGDGGQSEPYMTPDGKMGVSPNKPTVFPNLPKGTVIWPSMRAFAVAMPHYAKGTVSNKIADIRANYSMQKISVGTFIKELESVEKHYKLTEAQHRSLAVSISAAQRKLANQSASNRKKSETAQKKKVADQNAANKNEIANIETEYKTGKISRTKYIADLKNIEKHHKLDSALIRKVNTDISTAQKQYKTAQTKLNKDIASAATTYANKVKSINTDLTSKISDINSDLASKVKDLQDTYNSDLTSKQSDVYGQIGLFDEPSGSPAYKQDLLYNLQEQVNTSNQWQGDLSNLQNRGVPSDLISELQTMGVSAAPQVHAMTSMDQNELSSYVALWQQKHAIANAEAAKEMAAEKSSTDQQIAAAKASAAQQISTAKANAVKQLQDAKTTFINKLNSYKDVKVAGVTLGANTVDGIIEGLKSQKGALSKELKSIAKTLKNTIKKELKIHSPSRVMRDEVGVNVGAGVAVGIRRSLPVVAAASSALKAAVVPQVPLLQATVPDVNQYRSMKQQRTQTASAGQSDTSNQQIIALLSQLVKKDSNVYLSGRQVTDDTSLRMAADWQRQQRRHGVIG